MGKCESKSTVLRYGKNKLLLQMPHDHETLQGERHTKKNYDKQKKIDYVLGITTNFPQFSYILGAGQQLGICINSN